MKKFSFNPPIIQVEENMRLIGVSSFECTNSVFNITDENNSLSINTPGKWNAKVAEKTGEELNKIIELRSLELHVQKEVGKRGHQIEIGEKE